MAINSLHTDEPNSNESIPAIELQRTAPPGPQPIPNGGSKAWLQVLGAHFLWFNTW